MTTLMILLLSSSDSSGSGTTSLLFLAMFVFVLYFFMIRPQAKKAKEQKNFIQNLEKGQRVVTSGGVHGRISQMDDRTLLLEVDKNVKIRVERNMVSVDFTKAIAEETPA